MCYVHDDEDYIRTYVSGVVNTCSGCTVSSTSNMFWPGEWFIKVDDIRDVVITGI